MLEKKAFIGMNKDASAKDLRPEEYRHAENLVAVTDGVGVSARLENMLGMRKTGMPVEADAVCIGLWNYREGNKIYGFYSSSITDSILEYDGITDIATPLVLNNLLGFDIDNPVHDVFYIDGLLYFNDGKIDGSGHAIRKVNIEYAKTGALNTIDDERALSLIKTPPLKIVTHNRLTDGNLTLTRPEIRKVPLQFATRYVYLDDEISVLSPISRIAPALDWDYDNNDYNYIKAVLSIDIDLTPLIKRVELCVRDKNDGLWSIYDEFDPDEFTIALGDLKGLEYDFYYDRSGATLSEQEAGTSAESVPRLSGAMELMENRLFVTSSIEEYDISSEDWDCVINIGVGNYFAGLNDAIYKALYYKENSRYTWGIVFFDEFGRKTAPVVRTQMSKQMPDTISDYLIDTSITATAQSDEILYNHPQALTAYAFMTGKPPIWAKKWQFARTENQTYSSWFKAKFLVMPLAQGGSPQTEEPPSTISHNVYLNGGYWYQDVKNMILGYIGWGEAANSRISLGSLVDLVIPDGFPIPIDENSIIRLAFNYPVDPDHTQDPDRNKQNYRVQQIENGRIRVKGLQWIDIIKIWIENAEAMTGVGLNETTPKQQLWNEQAFMHFEILNPIKKVANPLMYEFGTLYDIKNAGTASRSFDNYHSDERFSGDCYMSAYTDHERYFVRDPEDNSVIHSRPKPSATRTTRNGLTISYASLSPIADIDRAGTGVIGGVPEIAIGSGGTFSGADLSLAPPSEDGLYYQSLADDKGRVTVEVPNQQELRRGSQVRFSRTFIQDSLINGLSNFPEENKHAISSDRGDIVKLVATNERVLVAVHTRSVTSLYINQKFINSGEGAAFLAQTDSVIGDDRKNLLNYGTTHPESIVLHDSRVYGFDSIMSEPWRRSQDGITPLALTYGMKTYFEEKGEQIRRVKTLDPSATITVLGGYDQWLDMYVLTFSKIEYNDNGTPITIPAETLGFSERVKRWVSFYTFKPEYYSAIMNNLVSAKDRSLWRHMDTEDRNLFYEEHSNSQITIVSTESNDKPKIYQNLGISSNEKWSMTCVFPDGKESVLDVDNFVLKDNIFYANFLRDKNTPTSNLKAGQIPMLHGEKLIGETMEITLTNDGSNKVVLDAVYIGYSPIAGHLLSQK